MTSGLRTVDGVELEHRWDRPAVEGDEWATVVALHPHPQFGGDLHNQVLAAMARTLPSAGISVLRFNFRGTGRSGGFHDGGGAERVDVSAAVELAMADATEPIVVAAYSFGADVALACLGDRRVAGWVLIAPPCVVTPRESWGRPEAPVLILRPRHDQYAPAAEPTLRGAAGSVRVEVVEAADHFLAGRADAVAHRVEDFVEDLRRGTV